MKNLNLNVLVNSELFENLTIKEVSDILQNIEYKVKNYSKNEIIASEGDDIDALSIILSGIVSIEKLYSSGKVFKIKNLTDGDLIGIVSMFSDYSYFPSTIIATNDVSLLIIPKEEIMKLFKINQKLLANFMRIISNQTVYLSKRLKFISYETIRKKICYFILEQYKMQGNLKIKVSQSRKEMAEMFGVTRVALSSELSKMKKEGSIEYSKKTITIKDISKLEN